MNRKYCSNTCANRSWRVNNPERSAKIQRKSYEKALLDPDYRQKWKDYRKTHNARLNKQKLARDRKREARRRVIQFLTAAKHITSQQTMKDLTVSLKKQLNDVHRRMMEGIEAISGACKDYVAILDENREATINFMRSRNIPEEMLDLMENVGRGRMHPKLMFMPGPGPERLQRAPLSEQERLLSTGVEVVKVVGDEIRREFKPVHELSKAEAEIAIDSSGNTPVEKQAERLKERLLSKTFKMPPYSLDGDTLLARENCRIPFTELERLYSTAKEAHDAKLARIESDVKRRQIAKD